MISVRIDLSGMKRLKQKLTANPALMRKIGDAWATIFRSYVRLAFHKKSRGQTVDGISWPPLAPSTIRRRRRRSSVPLRDTGRLYASLQPTLGASGLIQSRYRPLGVEMALGGSPLSTIASYHDAGNPPHLPQRQIMPTAAGFPEAEKQKMRVVAAKLMAAEGNS